MRKPFIAGNWKMNTDIESSVALAKAIADGCPDTVRNGQVTVGICPPFVFLSAVSSALSASPVALGAQNMHFEAKGAFTGEISAGMLIEAGCKWFLAGHSERRHILNETDAIVRKKLDAGLAAGMSCVLCVGELLEQREAGRTEEVVRSQIEAALANQEGLSPYNLVIAYEPVWAIGTGKTASPEQAQEIHAFIRNLISETYGNDLAQNVSILYGGSVKPGNAAEIMSGKDINGALVGGASMKSDSFIEIVAECR